MDTLLPELHSHIYGYLGPLDRVFARCAWAGFARVMSINRASYGISLHKNAYGALRPKRRQRPIGYYIGQLGRIDVAARALSAGIVRPKKLLKWAAEAGRVEMLKWLHEQTNGANLDVPAAKYAAAAGQIDALKFLVEAGYRKKYLRDALTGGYINCAEYLHTADDYTLESIAAWAAESGDMRMIKYARSLGCQFGLYAFRYALYSGNIECIEHLYSPEYTPYIIDWIIMRSHRSDILDWLAARNYKFTADVFDAAASLGR